VADAARDGDRATLRTLLQRHADVNLPEADGTTALHWAARAGDAAMVDLLIEAGANVKAANTYGVTPLSLAAVNGDAAVIARLLNAGADPNTKVTEGETVLMLAARTGKTDAIKELAAHGADVNAQETWMGENALMWAAAHNNAAAVKMLVEFGAKTDARSTSIKYPDQKPIDPSNYVVSFPPKGQWTALMYAARENAMDAADALIEAGADINAQDPEGVTALLEAVENVHFDLAARLLNKGADPNVADKAGMTPLFAAIEMRTPMWERSRPDPKELDNLDCVGIMKALLDHGANPNAALKGRMLQRYHANGSNLFAAGTTPLMRAVRYDNLDMAQLLVSRGADVTPAQPDGTTAIMIAAGIKYALTQEGDPANSGTADDAYEVVKLLAEHGADVNAVNAKGETALYGAAFAGRNRAIHYLADHGARLDTKTRQGYTILDGALNTGVPDEGTGARTGGKPGPATAALVRELMVRAGVEPTFTTRTSRQSIHEVPAAPPQK
jgi:ankyrin repeat protein